MIALAALTLSLHLQQTSFDLLDPVSVEVAVHNPARVPTSVEFPAPTQYVVTVKRGTQVIWTSPATVPPGVSFPPHRVPFEPGPSVLAIYVWNGLESDGTVPAPGDYTVSAKLLGTHERPTASARVHFIAPVPIAAARDLKLGDTITIAGTLDSTKGRLTDASGSVLLARRLLNAPPGTVAVRGYLMLRPDRHRVFYVQRWAPMQ